jgi:hypothetical protein
MTAQRQIQVPDGYKFGERRRYQNVKAFPYFYGFVPYPFRHSIVNQTTGIYDASSAQAEGPDGFALAAGGTIEIPIVMDRDTSYHLLHVRYGAFLVGATGGAIGSRHFLTGEATAFQGGRSYDVASYNQLIPRWTELDVSVYMVSSGARDLYGGFQRDAQNGSRHEIPVPAMTLQGDEDGMGELRTAFQLPKAATVSVKIRNRGVTALHVYGHLFGYKITV